MLTREQLEALPRKDVQHYAKEAGLKANGKTATLIEELLALWAVAAGPSTTSNDATDAAPSPAAASSPQPPTAASDVPPPSPKHCSAEECVEEAVASEAPAEVPASGASDAMVDVADGAVDVDVQAPLAAGEAPGASPAEALAPEPAPLVAAVEAPAQVDAPVAAVQDHGPRRSSERVRKSQESKARSKKQIESRVRGWGQGCVGLV